MFRALEIANEEESSTREPLEEHVQQVLNSPHFLRAETQRRLLEYLWNHRSENLNEYALATDALGRKADFDSTTDASGRVHISGLRRKLKDYYRDAGEPDILWIPTGTPQPPARDVAVRPVAESENPVKQPDITTSVAVPSPHSLPLLV